ncbi:MAG: response regulator [Myxococcota bacterium]
MGESLAAVVDQDTARLSLFRQVKRRAEAWVRWVSSLSLDPSRGEAKRLLDELRDVGHAAVELQLMLLAEEVASARAIVKGAATLGRLDESQRDEVMATLARLTRYAEEQILRNQFGDLAPEAALRAAMFVPAGVLDGLVAEEWKRDGDDVVLRPERFEARQVERVLEQQPEVLVVDLDFEGAKTVLETVLTADAHPPVIAIGAFDDPAHAAPLVAQGVAQVLRGPAAPAEIRRACFSAIDGPHKMPFEPIRETTVVDLRRRLSDELERGLVEALDAKSRTQNVDLEGGAEELVVLWHAIGRIREMLTARSRGGLSFGPAGPLGVLPASGWASPGRKNKGERGARRAEVTPSFEGLRILVAEDDLSVNWFLTGLLRQRGADVVGVRDGEEGLASLREQRFDLVLAGVVMPHLDGVSLCHRLARDPLLERVPVVLTSWKEDLLERARDLGAGAAGYVRKQAEDREVLRVLSEVTRPLLAVRDRLAEVSVARIEGRLDGRLSALHLVELVRRYRPSSRLTVRDHRSYLELEVREGEVVAASLTRGEGQSVRGAEAVGSILAMTGGRFAAVLTEDPVESNLERPLESLLADKTVRMRAMLQATRAERLLLVDRLELAPGDAIGVVPAAWQAVVDALRCGRSPRDLILGGQTDHTELSALVRDLIRQDAVIDVVREGRSLAAKGADPIDAAEMAAFVGDAERSLLDELDLRPSAYVDEAAPEASAPDESGPQPTVAEPTPQILAPVAPSPDATPAGTVVLPAPALAELAPDPPPTAEEPPPAKDEVEDEEEPRRRRRRRRREYDDEYELAARMPGPSVWATRTPPPTPDKAHYNWAFPVVFGAVGIALALGARWYRQRPTPPPAPVAVVAAPPVAQAPPPPAPAAPPPPEVKAPEDGKTVALPPSEPEVFDLTKKEKEKLKKKQGLLEVVAGRGHVIFIDGKKVGKGPVVRKAIAGGAQPHEIRVRMKGEERVRYVKVERGKRTRLRVAPPWSR